MIDKRGMKYGKLLVFLPADINRKCNAVTYVCICDCGKISIVDHKNLRMPLHTGSCGCSQRENARETNYLGDGVCSFNGLYSRYSSEAKRRGFEFLLTKEEFKILTKSDCFYCGTEPYQSRVYGKSTPYIYNGVDRKDNNLGYTIENSAPCCGVCNLMKRTMGETEFLSHIKKIYDYKTDREVSPYGVNRLNSDSEAIL